MYQNNVYVMQLLLTFVQGGPLTPMSFTESINHHYVDDQEHKTQFQTVLHQLRCLILMKKTFETFYISNWN